jgi:hypothetical protein
MGVLSRDLGAGFDEPRGDIIATKTTREIIESHLNCKYKGYLKLTG